VTRRATASCCARPSVSIQKFGGTKRCHWWMSRKDAGASRTTRGRPGRWRGRMPSGSLERPPGAPRPRLNSGSGRWREGSGPPPGLRPSQAERRPGKAGPLSVMLRGWRAWRTSTTCSRAMWHSRSSVCRPAAVERLRAGAASSRSGGAVLVRPPRSSDPVAGVAGADRRSLPRRDAPVCTAGGSRHVQAFFDYWIGQIPTPLTSEDRAAGYRWELSMRQVEVSRRSCSTTSAAPQLL
jgi:hypothetical protein